MCFCYCRIKKQLHSTSCPAQKFRIAQQINNWVVKHNLESDSLVLSWLELYLFRNHLTFLSSVSRFVICEKWRLFPVGLLCSFWEMPGHKWSMMTEAWKDSSGIFSVHTPVTLSSQSVSERVLMDTFAFCLIHLWATQLFREHFYLICSHQHMGKAT